MIYVRPSSASAPAGWLDEDENDHGVVANYTTPLEAKLLRGMAYVLCDRSETDPLLINVGVFSTPTAAILFTETDPLTWHKYMEFAFDEEGRWIVMPMVVNEPQRFAEKEVIDERTRSHEHLGMVRQRKIVPERERDLAAVDGRMGYTPVEMGVESCPRCQGSGRTWQFGTMRMKRVECDMCKGLG